MRERIKNELSSVGKWVIPVIIIIIAYKFFDNISFFYSLLCTLLRILTPFLFGFFIAYFLNRPVTAIEGLFKKTPISKHSRTAGVITVYTLFAAAIYIILRVLLPMLFSGIKELIEVLPQYGENLMELLSHIHYLKNLRLTIRATEMAEQFISSIKLADVTLYFQRIIDFGSVVVNIFLSIVVSAYMVLEKDALIAVIRRTASLFMSAARIESAAGYIHESDHVVYRYFVGQFLDCLIVSVGSTIGLWILGAPYPLVLGFLFGMFNIIPYFGPIISGVFVILIILLADLQNNLMLAVWCSIFLLVFQQIDANFINPRILGNALDMSPFWVIFAVTVFSGIFGFAGMIIGVPCVAIIRFLYRDLIVAVKKRRDAAQQRET